MVLPFVLELDGTALSTCVDLACTGVLIRQRSRKGKKIRKGKWCSHHVVRLSNTTSVSCLFGLFGWIHDASKPVRTIPMPNIAFMLTKIHLNSHFSKSKYIVNKLMIYYRQNIFSIWKLNLVYTFFHNIRLLLYGICTWSINVRQPS